MTLRTGYLGWQQRQAIRHSAARSWVEKAIPPRRVPRGDLALVSACYFSLAGFGLALVLGAFLVPHPQAMVIPPLKTSG
jgi:hypothetical protein